MQLLEGRKPVRHVENWGDTVQVNVGLNVIQIRELVSITIWHLIWH